VDKRIFGFLLLLCPLLFPGQSTGLETADSPATFRVAAARRTVELIGFTRPLARIALISEEEGRCRGVDLDVGDVAGIEGTFARLEETFIELELERNRAEQGRARSERSYYAKELKRFEELALSEAVAQSALDNAQFRLEQAMQQQAALEVQERMLTERLERHVIKAPSGWTIIARDVEPGQWVARGQQVGVAGDFSSLKVPFALTMEELAALKAMGSPIPVSLPDLSARAEANLETVSPDFDAQTRKVHVELTLRKGDFSFRGGLRTSLFLSLPESGSVFLVPETALLQAYEEHFLLRPEGVRVPVVVLRASEGMARVASGEIAPGEEFLLAPGTAPGVNRP
jgi:RND family efflux transporter MFP subunit